MAELGEVVDGLRIKRTRKRIDSLKFDRADVAERIKSLHDKDQQERSADIDARLQRYSKYRGWTEGKTWPFDDSSDVALPDMMTAAMRLEDTLHNAVMSQRPPVMAKATREAMREKEEKVNSLLDFQFFEEQPGEDIVGKLAHAFVIEGYFVAYTPWIDETRTVCEVTVHTPTDAAPEDDFLQILSGLFHRAEISPEKELWDWKIKTQDGKRATASFYTRDTGEYELELLHEAQVFDGPRCIPKSVQEVLYPAGAENLQIKSPSNPKGSGHVILIDYPSVDELKRLKESGYYDLMSDEDAEKLGIKRMDESYQDLQDQKNVMAGHVEMKDLPKGAESQKPLTRLMMFDSYDINGDGLDEDVIWWMILEDKILLRAKYLTQMFPGIPPRRPFAEAELFADRIGLLEMMEGVHDLRKMNIDTGMDRAIIDLLPFFFYKPSSNIKAEAIKLHPGEGYPLTNPQQDVFFPNRGNSGESFMFNVEALATQWQERLTTIGELQLGRVPQGKASALRTVSGMQTVLAQGDARPERVLRRFFMGLAQIWQNFHNLNEVFLKGEKQFMVLGEVAPNETPYRTLKGPQEIRGKFRFTFSANALNTSKEATQMALEKLMGAFINPLAIQLGIAQPEGAYRLMRDYGKSLGQDSDKYINPPTPGAMQPPISMEDAVDLIMDDTMPAGSPMEGAEGHFQKLMEFRNSDQFAYLEGDQLVVFKAYLEKARQQWAQEQAQAAMMQAASQMQQSMRQPGMPGPAGQPQPAGGMPMVNGGELLDESLPGAGGGANQGGA